MPGNLYSNDYAAFIETVKAMRVERGVTQADLAARLGQPQSFVSKSERKERRIDVVEFIQFAKALGVSPLDALRRVQEAVEQAGGGASSSSPASPASGVP